MSEMNMEVDSQQQAVAGSSSAFINQQQIPPRDVVGSLIMTLDDDEENNSDSDDVIVLPVEQDISGPSPAKKGKLVDFNDDHEETCLICYNPFTTSGEHRLSCLACGHIFGHSCIKKWLKTAKTCPQCKDRAKLKDIRVLFAKSLQALDTAERDRALHDLEVAKIERQIVEIEVMKLKLSIQSKERQIHRLKEEVEANKLRVSKLQVIAQRTLTSNSTQMKGSTSHINVLSSGKRLFSNIIHGCFND